MNRNRKRLLSDSLVAEARPQLQEYAIADTALRGFALRVQPSGAKSWILRIKRNTRHRRLTLGSADAMTVDEARLRAHALMANKEPPSPPKASPLFRDFAARYRKHRKTKWTASTLEAYDSYAKTELLPKFGRKRLAAIQHADVAKWFYAYSRRSPGGANTARVLLKALFNTAKEWGVLREDSPNPCTGLIANRRPPRGRLLNEAALERLGQSLDRYSLRRPCEVDAIRLILLTGCRPGEIARLQWSEVKSDRLLLKTSKTGPRTVLLGTAAQEILHRQQAKPIKPHVFHKLQCYQRPTTALVSTWRSIRRDAALPADARLHDLRHTYASHAVMNGESMLITAGLLGHRDTQMTSRYAHLHDHFVHAAAERVATRIEAWITPIEDHSTQCYGTKEQ